MNENVNMFILKYQNDKIMYIRTPEQNKLLIFLGFSVKDMITPFFLAPIHNISNPKKNPDKNRKSQLQTYLLLCGRSTNN